jgi:hypothetical protein
MERNPYVRALHAGALVVLVLALSACMKASTTFGSQARFSPAFQGYVMAKDGGSDDPGEDDTVLVLRDPITGKKLRCRDEVATWRELHEDLAVDQARDHNVAVAAGTTSAVVFTPLLVVQPTGALLLAEAIFVNDGLYNDFRSANATELLAGGIRLYKRKRFHQATTLIERALAKDASVGIFDKAFFYLGLSYAEQNNEGRARLALATFVDQAGVRDVHAYRKAEMKLGELGVRRKPCDSVEPVELHW